MSTLQNPTHYSNLKPEIEARKKELLYLEQLHKITALRFAPKIEFGITGDNGKREVTYLRPEFAYLVGGVETLEFIKGRKYDREHRLIEIYAKIYPHLKIVLF